MQPATTNRKLMWWGINILVLLYAFVPVFWLLSLSLRSKAGVFEYPPRWIPRGATLANYAFALTHTQVPWYLWNSAVVALAATAATLAASIPAAYVLSRERFTGRRALIAALLAVVNRPQGSY